MCTSIRDNTVSVSALLVGVIQYVYLLVEMWLKSQSDLAENDNKTKKIVQVKGGQTTVISPA